MRADLALVLQQFECCDLRGPTTVVVDVAEAAVLVGGGVILFRPKRSPEEEAHADTRLFVAELHARRACG